jgi:phosphoglycolate phosphatase-like HAD superfamily hydrolase
VDLSKYKSIIFDCDGVLFDSNSIKTSAFFSVTSSYGVQAASALLEYHVKNGGISRYEKFEYFLKVILPEYYRKYSTSVKTVPSLNFLLETYSLEVFEQLKCCDVTDKLSELRQFTSSSKWMIVSGSDQEELRKLIEYREIDQYFDAGIFGSPKNKFSIFNEQIGLGNIQHPAVFLGDSKLDFEVSHEYAIDFVFVSEWTEFAEWKNFFASKDVELIPRLSDLLK